MFLRPEPRASLRDDVPERLLIGPKKAVHDGEA